jgi:hypothetical protein
MGEEALIIAENIEASDRLAYKLKDAAAMIGISYGSLRNEIKRGKIFPTQTFNVIAKEELLRYLREETQIRRRKHLDTSKFAHEFLNGRMTVAFDDLLELLTGHPASAAKKSLCDVSGDMNRLLNEDLSPLQVAFRHAR